MALNISRTMFFQGSDDSLPLSRPLPIEMLHILHDFWKSVQVSILFSFKATKFESYKIWKLQIASLIGSKLEFLIDANLVATFIFSTNFSRVNTIDSMAVSEFQESGSSLYAHNLWVRRNKCTT